MGGSGQPPSKEPETLVAITRAVSSSISDCALSHIERQPIDVAHARRQHRAYEDCLRELGIQVNSLPAEPDLPDAVFVEDTAVVVDEVAVMAAPRLQSRRREVVSVARALSAYRPLRWITGSGLLEGGDVLRIGRTLYAGMTERTNHDGISQLAAHLEPFDYQVRSVQVSGCLHLKSACTYLGRDTILVNRAWVDTFQLEGLDALDVASAEPGAANVLLAGDSVLMPASFPQTKARLEEQGISVRAIDVSELQKAEAGVTCCSIVLESLQ